MKITALDIKKQEFARSFRGYDPDEVDSFLQVIAMQWQELVDDLRRSQERLEEQQRKLDHYMKVEEALGDALQTARTSARETVENAERKAAALLEEAEDKIVRLQKEADMSRLDMKRETAKYAVRQQEIVAKLRSFLVSEMEMAGRRLRCTAMTWLIVSMIPRSKKRTPQRQTISERTTRASKRQRRPTVKRLLTRRKQQSANLMPPWTTKALRPKVKVPRMIYPKMSASLIGASMWLLTRPLHPLTPEVLRIPSTRCHQKTLATMRSARYMRYSRVLMRNRMPTMTQGPACETDT
jgi:DivIVA domain-containing protein